MQIFFKYSFSLEGKHVLTGKKVISSKQSQFFYDFTFAYLIWKELCSLFSFFFFLNSLPFPSVSVYLLKLPMQLLLPFPQSGYTWSGPDGVKNVNSDIMTFCFAYTVLVLVQSELILVRMVLRFGFVTKTALMTQGCFSYCWTTLTQS